MSGRHQEQKHLIEVRRSRIQGWGIYALKKLRKGQRIIEYIGERIHPRQEQSRYEEEANRRHHTFLFSVSRYTTIDGGVGGNESRFINHSCDPNCEAINDGRRIFIHAARDIAAGEELTYDYSYDIRGDQSHALKQYYVCHCKSDNCRGTIMRIRRKRPSKQRRAAAL